MRLGVLVAVLLLFVACSGCDGDSSGGGGGDPVDERKAAVDDVARTLLPILAAAAQGEFPHVAGEFTQCGVGRTNLHYVVDGEIHGDASPRASVTALVEAAEAEGFTFSVRELEELRFVGERDGLRLAIGAYPQEVAGSTISLVNLKTDCEVYSGDDADRALGLPDEVYGAPLRPQG